MCEILLPQFPQLCFLRSDWNVLNHIVCIDHISSSGTTWTSGSTLGHWQDSTPGGFHLFKSKLSQSQLSQSVQDFLHLQIPPLYSWSLLHSRPRRRWWGRGGGKSCVIRRPLTFSPFFGIYNHILVYTLVQDDYTDEMEEGEEMYSMSVKLAAANHKTSDKISLLEKRSDSATVSACWWWTLDNDMDDDKDASVNRNINNKTSCLENNSD